FRHAYHVTEVGKARHPEALLVDAAGHDAAEVAKVRIDIEAEPCQAPPAFAPDANGRDPVLAAIALVGAAHPHADPFLAALAADVERSHCADQPFLEVRHEPAHVAVAALQVEHHVGDALARPLIGELTPAACRKHRKPRLNKVFRARAGAG